ncbi:hypothetical protein SAMN05192583_3226 [Sphingomonas gellani]|uniref:Uncharacterized protein n=1 Tax=Sphingomonas gellani TaxID=1166340 RepID=A0A1H8I7I5_9SPHN|nr:hypothetical protein [Sphingomonas gellani]SEN64105.1 hypothetical protein SAMN05192583_3226 [Sphingomonas gellani]
MASMPHIVQDGDADGDRPFRPPVARMAIMGFTINHGSAGVLTILSVLLGVGVAVIVAVFVLNVVKDAHDDVIEEDEPND